MRARLMIVLGCVGVLLAGLLAACTSSSNPHQRTSTGCRSLCAGAIDGAAYSILVPSSWNGTLLVYSHGFQANAKQLHPYLSPTDTTGFGTDAISKALLKKGYALAGSAFPSAGWSVAGAVTSDEQLYAKFGTLVRKPSRTIAWGSSMGGLVTELLAERASWVTAAAAMCGVVAGPVVVSDNSARALAVIQLLTGVDLTLTGSESAAQLYTMYTQVTSRITALALQTDGGAGDLLAASTLLGLPQRSQASPDTTLAGRVRAAAQNLILYAELAISTISDLAHRYGSGFTDPQLAKATLSLPTSISGAVTALHGDATSLQSRIRSIVTPSVSSSARSKVAASGTPTGHLRVPLLTVHGEDDPVALVANETVLKGRVDAAGQAARLRQVYIAPATTGPSPAYGVGHCLFSTQQQVGAIVAVDRWSKSGTKPTDAQLAADLGPGTDSAFTAPRWPM